MKRKVPSFVEAALRYHELGYRIVLLRPRSKRPLLPKWATKPPRAPAEIKRLYAQYPDAQLGLMPPDGCIVVDVDPRNGGEIAGLDIPENTPTQRSGGGGMHYVVRVESGVQLPRVPGIDYIVPGKKQFVAWPSIHPDTGRRYEWIIRPWDAEPVRWVPSRGEGVVEEGARNETLASLAGKMRRLGASLGEIKAALLAFNETRCVPPLDEAEVIAVAASIARYEPVVVSWPPPIDLRELAKTRPEPPRLIMEGLPVGYATGSFGHGGLGKSSIELMRAVCIAAGTAWWGLRVTPRRVLFLSCEDRIDVLYWRLSRICRYLGIDLRDLDGLLVIYDLVGRDSLLYRRDSRGEFLTENYHQLADRIRSHAIEVLFVDGVTDTFGGNENDRAEVKQYVNAMVGLVPPDRGAVVLVGHVNKSMAVNGETGEGYSGSTAWHNSVRARWYLRPEGERLRFEVQKSNLDRSGLQLTFEWNEDAHLFIGRRIAAASESELAERDRKERDAILEALRSCAEKGIHVPASTTGRRTTYNVLLADAFFPESLRTGGRNTRARFWEQVERLRHSGQIVESESRDSQRHRVTTLVCAETRNARNDDSAQDASIARARKRAMRVIPIGAHESARTVISVDFGKGEIVGGRGR